MQLSRQPPGCFPVLFFPEQSSRVANSPSNVPAWKNGNLILALCYRRRGYLRDSPALPLGGVGLDKQVHFHAKVQKLGPKIIGDDAIPLVVPLFDAVDGSDAG